VEPAREDALRVPCPPDDVQAGVPAKTAAMHRAASTGVRALFPEATDRTSDITGSPGIRRSETYLYRAPAHSLQGASED
jgi:hypothetical protein